MATRAVLCLLLLAPATPLRPLRPAPSLRRSLRSRSSSDDLLSEAAQLRAEISALEADAATAAPPPVVAPAAASASEFAPAAATRDAFLATLGSLKADGKAPAWASRELVAAGAEVPTEARVRAATGIDGAKDLLAQEEVGNDELLQITAFVFVTSAILAVGSGALIGGNLGAAFTYIFAVLPIIFLGVGSSSPGVILAVYGATKQAKENTAPRRRRHEAAHLVAGYALGLPVAAYADDAVEFYDGPGPKSRDDAERLACVALAGAVAECDAFGEAKGAQDDFANLQRLFDRVEPRLTPAEQQAATRRGVLNAYSVLFGSRARRDASLVDAADDAMAAGASLPELLAAVEAAAAAK